METGVGERVDVAVVGAGFGGLGVACVCADAGFSVTILERRPRLAPEGVGIVLQPNGLAVLERLGVLQQVLAVGHRITTVRQCDPSGRVRAVTSYAELRHPHPYLVCVERTSLISLLADRLFARTELRTGCAAGGLERQDGRVSGVRYADASGAQHTLRAACVVGADGINSVIREALGVRTRNRTGPDRYVLGLAPCKPADDAAVLYCGPGWCDGVLPYGDHTYFFDHITDENREAVQRRDFDAWRDNYIRRIPDASRIVADLGSFEDLGFLSGRTHRAVQRVLPGVALVGDAAAAVHPHSGQGANLALEDALALGAALAAHGPHSTAALGTYARARNAKLRRYVPWSIFIGRTFDGPGPGWRAVRRVGYLASHLPPARRASMRQHAGLG
ncbi:MAG: FAD-dependent monooxygenase [Actinomycetota bacterium]|nr:FAD-dependent monooxygenase [Actinomycetota bacterium]